MSSSSSYELYYLETHGLGLLARILLSMGGFEWSDMFPKNWSEEKATTPLGKLPVLTETRADGTKFVLAESSAIYSYIARKAKLHGDTEEESALIDQFYSSWYSTVVSGRQSRNLRESNPEQYKVEYSKYLEKELRPTLAKHEQHLASTSSGYYVGNKLSFVDIATKMAVDRINSHEVEITEQAYPHIYKLVQEVSELEVVKEQLSRFG
ncbi:hypothetical protein INT43_000466 [Umbelopsis isabellina]|uniref:Glutathione S-transferase n=1 Tax=Mortierella isabellina TaxID=91625 RepID=A0A8H7Q1U1_MORIS|nr:hypothetical protein INT43_000466 [Umbelopsis isabellina]